MKHLFFFFLLLCIPIVAGLAVTPTSLDLTNETTGMVIIYNTRNQSMEFTLHGVYEENFTLAPLGKKEISFPVEKGTKTSLLVAEEHYENGVSNAIAIPVLYQRQSLFGESAFLSDSEIISLSSAASFIILLFFWYAWKKKWWQKIYIKKFVNPLRDRLQSNTRKMAKEMEASEDI